MAQPINFLENLSSNGSKLAFQSVIQLISTTALTN